ncbi:MAG: substrate-binding domain-containing protein [Candidatus Zeuxoniibacter abyssi]|nr:MAG: substrate-binding domain-containing protein [Candidatus Persebacteraceae bacterium AB1(2)]
MEAGGYTELNTQISQIEDCVAGGADAVVIGAISNDGLNNLVGEIRDKGIPVIDVINGMSSPELSAKSLVSFGEMGAKTGEFLAKNIPVAKKLKWRGSRTVGCGLGGGRQRRILRSRQSRRN